MNREKAIFLLFLSAMAFALVAGACVMIGVLTGLSPMRGAGLWLWAVPGGLLVGSGVAMFFLIIIDVLEES